MAVALLVDTDLVLAAAVSAPLLGAPARLSPPDGLDHYVHGLDQRVRLELNG